MTLLSVRDPIHGFVRADALEAALVDSRPLQRLRSIHQLGFAFLVFPGAEHTRFGHVLGAMELAGRLFDALVAKSRGLIADSGRDHDRRVVRAAALLHDLGHPPFSHSAEERFDAAIDHEEMTRRLLASDEIRGIFAAHGEGLEVDEVARLLAGEVPLERRYLAQIVSGELDVDKMDYLLRDSLFCGVRYGSYDLPRLLDTVAPIVDPETGAVGIGVEEGGVHAVEALVLARYYMFTQVYFNVTGKALEHHFTEWLRETGRAWPSDPERFLEEDDVALLAAMRRSPDVHARAVVERSHFPLAYETREHLGAGERQDFESILPELRARFGEGEILISRSAKDPHRLGPSRVLVERFDGRLEPMERASHFLRHLTRIDRYRIYARPAIRDEVARIFQQRLQGA
ncbi:MAG: HD domain-containing protein [Thermoanaerobaculia bacterium]